MSADEILEIQGRNEVLGYLAEYYLEGPAVGIARKVIAEGTRNLTSKQQYVYDKSIREPYLEMKCSRMGDPLPTSEITFALENDGLCTWCARMKEKREMEDD